MHGNGPVPARSRHQSPDMALWETEDEYSGPAAASLPTPQDTPYRTPSHNSRRSRRSVTPPDKSSSPPPMPSDKNGKRSSKDISNDESISILDPRRFTPTLHASLVAEILSLRRDQEDKTKIIENLESALHSSRQEHDQLRSTLTGTSKESRSLKRQLALLEGGTSSALGELARERDEAADSAAETKKRLEAAQKKLRLQEEDSQRVHSDWARERDGWVEERRKFERKIHVVESRLKVVLEEVAAYQAAQANGYQNGLESEADEAAHGRDDAVSVRTMSMTNSIRFSVAGGGQGLGKANGHSLADELNLEGDDEWQTEFDGRDSVLSTRHTRTMSKESLVPRPHRRNQSMESLKMAGGVRKLFANQAVLETLEDGIREVEEEAETPTPKPSYVDTGIQFSPPPSPKLVPSKPSTPEPVIRLDRSPEDSPRAEWEIEANQRRKRVHVARPLTIESVVVVAPSHMVSAGSQTLDEPLSPPKTPRSPSRSPPPPPIPQVKPTPVMVSSSTQTESAPPSPKQPPESFLTQPPLSIPSISIHPPTSRPTTPREPRLPQYFKHFGCQVNLPPVPCASVSVQTEEIRIDQRLAQLPPHLRPSAISSRPPSPESPIDDTRHFTPVPGNLPPRNPRRLTSKRSLTELPSSPPVPIPTTEITHDAYPGNNDDGPLSHQRAPMRRPHRISSLFAGFDAGASSDEMDEFGADADFSDSEFRTALSAPKPKGTAAAAAAARASKRSSSGTVTSPEQFLARRTSSRSSGRPIGGSEMYSTFTLPEGREVTRSSVSRALDRPPSLGGSNKASGMRKAAMIQSGIASHQGRSRSPSLPDARDPPFPIPTRASSRRPPISASAPSDGQRSPTRRSSPRGSHYRANSIRKVRSAAALPRYSRDRRRASRSPPPFSASTEAPDSPGLPPLPQNDHVPRMRDGSLRYSIHRSQPSTNTANTVTTDNGASQSAGVVDAIAQTMVGEWMFKYVRRRKSFGVPEATSKDENSNDRHKRWVWLAPYERSILWSSKQPSSNSTLMGKPGRKLVIQSVLDVKDDNPAPKGSSYIFNRSILILTPQRALKFTATSAERHYVWLTALSFLAHSSQAVPEIVSINAPKALPDFEPPRTKLRRAGIRDSIRLTKSRGTFSKATGPPSIPSVPSIQSVPSSRVGEPSTFRGIESFHQPSRAPEPFPPLPSSLHQREPSREAAEAPFIPRFHERANPAMAHGRRRSNTGGHVPPPLSFRGFSGPAGSASYHNPTSSVAGASVGTAGSSDIYQSHASTATWGMSSAGSQRTSEASSRPSNFFDAIGTVRMEAFISPLAYSKSDEPPDEQDEFRIYARRRSKEMRRQASRNRHRDSYNSRGTRGTNGTNGTDDWRRPGEEDFFGRDDPFKGF